LGAPVGTFRAAFSPDGTRLALPVDKTIKIWDVASGRELRTLEGHMGHVSALVFSPDGAHLASTSWDGTVTLWDLTGAEAPRVLKAAYLSGQVCLAISPDGKHLAAGDGAGQVTVWDLARGKEPTKLVAATSHPWQVISVDFSRDGKRLAAAV